MAKVAIFFADFPFICFTGFPTHEVFSTSEETVVSLLYEMKKALAVMESTTVE
jgi:hypothetical protein